MERNEFLEKIKRNWKKILIIGVASYVLIAFISTAVGAALITKRGNQIKKCEDRIGREFQARKADFLERYYDNWDKGLQKMSEGFARTQKISDRDQINGLKSAIERQEKKIESLREKHEKSEELARLERQQEGDRKNLAILQAAFDKSWTPQKESESTEQYQRRHDEARVDWWAIQLSRRIEDLEWYPEDKEEILEHIEEKKETFQTAQFLFLEKYGEEYPKSDPPNFCNL